jgi:hypothetical protein
MLLLLLLTDLPVQLLLFSPVILWFILGPQWHMLLILIAICFWGGLAFLLWRRFARSEAEDRSKMLPQGDWRWPPHLSAANYDQRCRLLLHYHGWHDLSAIGIETDAITILMQKDKARIVMRCQRGKNLPSPAEIDTLSRQRAEHHATLACLMLEGACPPAILAGASGKGVHVMRLADIPAVETAVSDLRLDAI